MDTKIEQIILYDEIKYNYFTITELNKRIIDRSKILESYKSKKLEDRIYRNINIKLNNEEIWKICPEKPGLQISNFGRVKIHVKGNNKIWLQKDKGDTIGYLILDDYKNIPGEYKDYISQFQYVYQLVARIWLGRHIEDGCVWEVHHITNAGYDNRPENLIWMKRCEHRKIDHRNLM